MHELSLCEAIAESALEHAGGRAIERISLRIGHFRQVVPETLQFCWTMRVEGTELSDTKLDIEHVPATIECGDCGRSTTLTHPVLRCGRCDGTRVEMITGEEFLIVSIDLAPEATTQEVH